MSSRQPVVVVTGGSRGLGLAIVAKLVNDLNAVAVSLSRTISPELRELAASKADRVLALECDVADESATSSAISKIIDTYHHIDALVLNAGIIEPIAKIGSSESTLASWKRNFDINFFSLLPAVQGVLPSLRKSEFGGRIVFVSSGVAEKVIGGWGAYSASKAAMNSFCRQIAAEEPSIFSVAVDPGVIDTPMQGVIRETGRQEMEDGVHDAFLGFHTNGVLLKAELPGSAIAALALKCPQSLSGKFVLWDSDACKEIG